MQPHGHTHTHHALGLWVPQLSCPPEQLQRQLVVHIHAAATLQDKYSRHTACYKFIAYDYQCALSKIPHGLLPGRYLYRGSSRGTFGCLLHLLRLWFIADHVARLSCKQHQTSTINRVVYQLLGCGAAHLICQGQLPESISPARGIEGHVWEAWNRQHCGCAAMSTAGLLLGMVPEV